MSDSPDTIRQQMDETRSQLSEKLVSLETQVTDTVQSTGTAVNATVEAVQVTVETVTGAVQDAVQSVSNAFDLRRQIERHPLLVFGGAVVLGYLAVEYLEGRAKNSKLQVASSSDGNDGGNRGPTAVEETAQSAALAASYKSGQASVSRDHLQYMAIRAVIGFCQNIATSAIPKLLDYFTGSPPGGQAVRSDDHETARDFSSRAEIPAVYDLRIATSDRGQPDNSF